MSTPLKTIWVPSALALSVTLTFFDDMLDFDGGIFLSCLAVITGHFYTTHLLGAKFLSVHYLQKEVYWKLISISYLPFIVSFWVGFILYNPGEGNFYLDPLAYPAAGLLTTIILFTVLVIAKVRRDADVILGWVFIIAAIGTASLVAYAIVLIKIFSWMT